MNREAVASELIRIAEDLIALRVAKMTWEECISKAKKNPDVRDPEALCGWLKNYGPNASIKAFVSPDELAKLPHMALNEIASLIYEDWENVNYAAKPYLEAMSTLRDIKDNYIQDTGYSIVAYFLSNASSWKGEVAKVVKKELNRRLKTAR